MANAAQADRLNAPVSPLAGVRGGGVCLHLSSLPGNGGIGTLGQSARDFVHAIADMGLRAWQFLPLGPTGYGNSPYQSLSSFAGNEMLLDLEQLVELGLLEAGEVRGLADLPRDRVDYGQLLPQKTALLSLASRRFLKNPVADLTAAYEAFVGRHDDDWLQDFALFRALKDHHGQAAWSQWERPFKLRDEQAVGRFAEQAQGEVEAIKVTQFLFDHQWQALRAQARSCGVSLFGDMPIYLAGDSADAWANPELLQMSAEGAAERVAGVPPDYFSADGQLWGNPLYRWSYHEQTGYRWWAKRLRHAMGQMDLVRIDHFRGFESFWSVAADAETARQGEWVGGPGSSLFDALAKALGTLPIVAEDLGLITPEVDALRLRHHLPGMKVLQFMVDDPAMNLNDIGQNCVVYTGTHDNDTSVGWFNPGPDDPRSRDEIQAFQQTALAHTSGTRQTFHRDLIELAFGSAAALAIIPMQDFLGLGSEARMNTPGTSDNNWRWRMSEDQLSPEVVGWIADRLRAAGRC